MSFELDELDAQTIQLLKESNDMFVEETNKIVADALSEINEGTTTADLLVNIITPLIGRANINAKLFTAQLLKNQQQD